MQYIENYYKKQILGGLEDEPLLNQNFKDVQDGYVQTPTSMDANVNTPQKKHSDQPGGDMG